MNPKRLYSLAIALVLASMLVLILGCETNRSTVLNEDYRGTWQMVDSTRKAIPFYTVSVENCREYKSGSKEILYYYPIPIRYYDDTVYLMQVGYSPLKYFLKEYHKIDTAILVYD